MNHHHKHIYQRGLSLIELMIAITISVALLAGVVQIFSNTKSTYRTQESYSRLSENVRFALDIMAQDISMSDFWGCNPTPIRVDTPDSGQNQLKDTAGASFIDFAQDGPTGTGGGLVGTEGDATAVGTPDLITVRGLTGTPARIMPLGDANRPVELAQPNTNFQVGQIVGLADCQSTDFFQITGIDADNVTIRHAADAGQPPQNQQGRLSKDNYRENSALYRAQQVTYFLQAGANGRQALWRNLNNDTIVELIPDVEDLQIKYGEDTNEDRVVDRYVDANAPGLVFDNVISVRVTLTISSEEDNVSPVSRTDGNGNTDNRLEKTVTTTIAMKNRLS